MIKRMPTHCGDETCSSCVVAGDYIFLAHHGGGHDKEDIVYQMRNTFESMKKTLSSVDATLDDMVQINLYLRDISDFRVAADVFKEYFKNKSQMELLEARGRIVDADFYRRQINNNEGLISGNLQNIAEWESEMADLRAVKFDTNSKAYKELQAKVRAAKSEIYEMKLEQEAFNQTLKQMPIDHLSTMVSMYGDITAKIENWGAVHTATGKKLDSEYYQTLISNGTTVIGQYEKQIKEIRSLMSEAQKGSTVWQELYDQLQNIDSATASMLTIEDKKKEAFLQLEGKIKIS